MEDAVLRINNLNMSERERGKLVHVSLVAMRGEVISLVGLDYSGKDLLTAILGGCVKANYSNMDLYICGERILDQESLKNHVFFSTKLGRAIGNWTVSEYVMIQQLGWILNRRKTEKLEKQLQEMIAQLGFDIPCKEKMESLSEIQRRQADLVKAVWQKSDILIIEDEFSGMTEQAIRQLAESMKKAAEGRLTIIVSSHSSIATYYMGEKYLVFLKGAIIQKCSRSEIRSRDWFNDYVLGRALSIKKSEIGRRGEESGSENNREKSFNNCIYRVNGINLPGYFPIDLGFPSGKVTTCLIPDHAARHQLYHTLNGREIRDHYQYMFRENVFIPNSQEDFFRRKIVSVENIGYPQKDSLMDEMTVADNLLLPSLYKLSWREYFSEKKHIVSAVSKERELDEKLLSPEHESEMAPSLVRDMDIKGRISILLERWLIYNPNVIIFFDPFLHCDNHGVAFVRSYIRRFTQRNTAVILIQSREEYAEDITDQRIDIVSYMKTSSQNHDIDI